jgi:octaprenyl-diphosphate synthase
MQHARDIVATEFEAVNALILEQLHSQVPLVENIGHYIVDAGGKRLRPLLVLLAGSACSNKLSNDHITQAAVIEFIHTATLLHDDVVDISSLRRGRPTANATWGNAPSVLVGDFLYTRAFQLLVSMGNMPVMTLLADTTNTIAEGEVLQLTQAGNPDITEADYFQVIKNKTAVLFAAATASAAILAQQDKATIDKLYQFGLEIGLAFQLIDDVLDYMGDSEEMGKNIGDDLGEGKATLPLIYAMAHGSETQRALIQNAIRQKDSSNIDKVITAVKESGALDYSKAIAENHSNTAKELLSELADNNYKHALLTIADIAVSRNK